MPKKPDEYGLLLNRAGPLCEALAAKGYVAVLGQAVHVFIGYTASLGVPITFFGPFAPPPATLYLTANNVDNLAEQVEALPPAPKPTRLVLPNGPLQA